MAERKTPILLRRSPLTNRVMAIHRYSRTTLRGQDVVKSALDGKQDVTADFDALMLEELMADDAPDVVGILDGVADGETLTDEERGQVRAFRERLRIAVERHNERIDAASTMRTTQKPA